VRAGGAGTVENPTVSLQGDAAATRLVLDAQDGPVILVGHSYGGAVITEAGTHDKVAALVYISAFAPDNGESVNTLIGQATPGTATSPILMIPPSSQHAMAKRAGATMAVEVAASHAVYWSHPGAVAALIRQVRV
jgi:pimeloyl-ACP methyl ester carboxylesterase